MSEERSGRGVLPDGKKISELRNGEGQDAFAYRAGVSLRTLQRAESGSRVSRAVLQRLASALGVPLNDISFGGGSDSRATPATEPVPAGRTHLALTKLTTAPEFTKRLTLAQRVDFEFDVDPSEQEATLIAEVIRLLKWFAIYTDGNRSWSAFMKDDESRILNIGKFNTLRRHLSEGGTNIFWADRVHLEDDELDEMVYRRRVMLVLFSNKQVDTLTYAVEASLSEEEARRLQGEYDQKREQKKSEQRPTAPKYADLDDDIPF